MRLRMRQILEVTLIVVIIALGASALHDQWPRARDLLTGVGPGHLALGLLLEAASLVAYTMVTRTLLARRNRPPFTVLLRIDLTGYGVSHVVPGGGLTAAALRVRMLAKAGTRLTDAMVLIAVQGIGGVLVLVVLLEWTLLLFAPMRIGDPAAVVAAAVFVLRRRSDWLFGVADAVHHRLPRSPTENLHEQVSEIAARLRALGADRPQLAATTGWIAANWLLDAAALWVILAAYGHRTDLAALLAAYCLANVLGLLPLTPGGLGVIEVVLISSLAGFGVPVPVGVIGVLTWRVVNFWLPIPVAGLSWLSLYRREHPGAKNHSPNASPETFIPAGGAQR